MNKVKSNEFKNLWKIVLRKIWTIKLKKSITKFNSIFTYKLKIIPQIFLMKENNQKRKYIYILKNYQGNPLVIFYYAVSYNYHMVKLFEIFSVLKSLLIP